MTTFIGGALSAAERSYPTSKVRGSGREETPRVGGQGGGREELPRFPGQWRPGGDIPCPRSGAAERIHLTPKARASGGRSNPRSGGCAGTGGPRGAIPR